MTVSEVVANSNRSCAQEIGDKVAEWSTQNRGIESYRIYLINRPGARFSKVPIINGPGKLSLFTLKIEVSIVLHLTR